MLTNIKLHLNKLSLPGESLVARYNWCQGPVPGRGPAVEKHCSSSCLDVKFILTICRIHFLTHRKAICAYYRDKQMTYTSITAYYYRNRMKHVNQLCGLYTDYSNAEQVRQCTYNITLWRVRATIAAVRSNKHYIF